jgi:hypothetical protein
MGDTGFMPTGIEATASESRGVTVAFAAWCRDCPCLLPPSEDRTCVPFWKVV